MSEIRRFAVADRAHLPQLLAGLEQRASFAREPTHTVHRVLFDTFDWRLFDKDTALEARTDTQGTSVVWRSLRSGEVLAAFAIDEPPRFAWDLPLGRGAARLAEVIEMRALLPLIDLRSTRTTLRLLDAEDKTVGRIVIDDATLPGGRSLPAVMEVVPVRGYDAEADDLVRLLTAQVLLTPVVDDLMVTAARSTGYQPGSYTSKLRLRLDPTGTARAAWVTVLKELFAAMLTNEAGLRDDVDSEFLHDYRVAVRRTRSILSQAKGIVAPPVLDHFKAEFAWLGQATGPTRDLDVFLLNVPSFQEGLSDERRGDLKPFQSFLEAQQADAHAALVAELDSPRYRALVEDWRAFLDDDPPVPATAAERTDTPDASAPAPAVAYDRIRRAHRRLVQRGRRIDDESPAEQLHDLRKDAKKLRYLLECFGGLFPADEITPVVKRLKALQEVLGEYQDCQLQVGSLERFAQQLLDDAAPAATVMAMGLLTHQLDDREHQARAGFGAQFASFDQQPVRAHLRAAAADLPSTAPPSPNATAPKEPIA